MIRYRCPSCAALIAAHERRAGQSSVCKACIKPHPIPTDQSLWLDEFGRQLPSTATEVPTPASPQEPVDGGDSLAPSLPEFELPEPVVGSQYATAPTNPPSHAAAVETLTPRSGWKRSQPPPDSTPAPQRGLAPLPVQEASKEPPPDHLTEQLRTQSDVVVALATRLRPQRGARRDLRPSTAAWLVLSGFGFALLLAALVNNMAYRWFALAIGIAQVIGGYVWIIRLRYRQNPRRAILCAVPPLTFVYLAQYKYARLRPLGFVLTGACIVFLAVIAPILALHARLWANRTQAQHIAHPDSAAMSKLEQLRHYRDQQAYNSLGNVLEALAKSDPLASADASDRDSLSAELQLLCQHTDPDVQLQAMAALARWDPVNARGVCLAAIDSSDYAVRQKALQLLPQWKDAECALAVQSLIDRPGVDSNLAKAALEKIGGPAAEEAALVLLHRADRLETKLTALSILERLGGANTAARLRTLATADEPVVQAVELAVADAIDVRLRASAPLP